jgi:hypothetical protein
VPSWLTLSLLKTMSLNRWVFDGFLAAKACYFPSCHIDIFCVIIQVFGDIQPASHWSERSEEMDLVKLQVFDHQLDV